MKNSILIVVSKEVYVSYVKKISLNIIKKFHWIDIEHEKYCIEYSDLEYRERSILLSELDTFFKNINEEYYLIVEVKNEYRGSLSLSNIVEFKGKLDIDINLKTEAFLPSFKMFARIPKCKEEKNVPL